MRRHLPFSCVQRKNEAVAGSSIRVLIADDSILFRKIIRDALSCEQDFDVVGVARNGADALEKIEFLKPDLVTLDVEMPGLTGTDVLRAIADRNLPTSALVVSGMTLAGIETPQEMLELGAFGFVVKPNGDSAAENRTVLQRDISAKLKSFRALHREKESGREPDRNGRPDHDTDRESGKISEVEEPQVLDSIPAGVELRRRQRPFAAVVIGVSTGGPDALRKFLPSIPGDFPLPILIVQHMPRAFTKSLAEGLDNVCALDVSEAVDGELVEPGRILIAAGGKHMRVQKADSKVKVELTMDPVEHNCRPSVDYLFRSAVDVYGAGTLGVIMTGMGEDGTEGCRQIKHVGGSVIAQDEESCVVFGMPRLPVEEGVADSVVPLSELGWELLKAVPTEICV